MTALRLATIAGGVAGGVAAALMERDAFAIAVTAVFCAALAALTVIDLRERRIPNRLTYAGTLVALGAAALAGLDAFTFALLGGLAAFGVMAAFYVLGRGRLGAGDVKLSMLSGAVLGLGAVPAFLLVGTALGALAGGALLLMGRGRSATFAYGPYLAAGAAVVLLRYGPVAG
jgi:leader peptidase (prepilin peptidase)/N-methyltransferase